MRTYQRYTQEFKDQAVERLKGCTNVEGLARELKGVTRHSVPVAG